MRARRQRALLARNVRRFGGGATVTLRRRNDLQDRSGGNLVTALELASDHLEGAATIDLVSPAGALSGTLNEGLELTIAGAAYRVTATARPVGDALSGVSITPSLASAAADGVPVAVPLHRQVELPTMRVSQAEVAADGRLVRISGEDFLVPAQSAALVPREQDVLVVDGGQEEVTRVDTVGSTNDPAGWILRRGAG